MANDAHDEVGPGSSAPSLVRSGAAPLYAQVADELRRRIEDGRWAEGTFVPAIERLMAEFGVSRVTIRDAIRRLSEEGLLSPQRGRGTLVMRTVRRRPLRVEATLAALVDTYRGDKPEVFNLDEGYATPDTDDGPGHLAPRYYHLRRVHIRDGTRYCIIALYIEAEMFSLAEQRFRDELVLPVLTDLVDAGVVTVTAARQSVTIGKCSADVASLLGYPEGDPIANVRRTILGPDDRVLYFASVIYRADCIRIDMDLVP